MDALVSGTIGLTPGNCFGIGGEESLVVASFPVGTILSADGKSITVPGHGELAIGDEWSSGGGYVDAGDDVPAECLDDDAQVVVVYDE